MMTVAGETRDSLFSESQEKLRREVVRKYTELAQSPVDEAGYRDRLSELTELGYPEGIKELPRAAVESFSGVGCPLRYANLQAGERVLDVGVGPGLDSLLASRRVGAGGTILGLDMNGAMLERCSRLLHQLEVRNVRLVQANGEMLPFADASFDLLISNGVSNLSPRKDMFFSEMARVLRPGGRLALADVMMKAFGTTPLAMIQKPGAREWPALCWKRSFWQHYGKQASAMPCC